MEVRSLSRMAKQVFKLEELALLVVRFLDVRDVVMLARTCRRLSKILKFPEIERLLLRQKAMRLERGIYKPTIQDLLRSNPLSALRLYHCLPQYRTGMPTLLPMMKKFVNRAKKEVPAPGPVAEPKVDTPIRPTSRNPAEFSEELSVLCSSLQMHREALRHRQMHLRLAPIALQEKYHPPFDFEEIIPFYKSFKRTSQKIRRFIREQWM